MAVPLVKEGMNYFFSGNYDGEQCKHGQHFKINVTHGQGLPESLKNPVPDSPAPNSADNSDNVPDTVIPSNFDNPINGGDVKAASGAAGRNVRIGLVVFVFFWYSCCKYVWVISQCDMLFIYFIYLYIYIYLYRDY